jgi:putative FmdB family regulatory protein
MAIYEFYCKDCDITKTLYVPLSEYYIPDCNRCSKPMKRIYTSPIINPGCLNGENIPND